MPDVLEPSSKAEKRGSVISLSRGPLSGVRRWARHTFTHDRVIPALKTFGWVAPLTLLIWIYAEREQIIRTSDPMPIPIEVTSADPTRIVNLLSPTEEVIVVELEGPRSELEALRREISGGAEARPIELQIGDRSVGRHEITTAALLGNHWRLATRGIRVVNAQPPILVISVDEFDEVELPVTAPPAVTNLAAPAVFSPTTVRVRAPSMELDQVREAGTLHAYADVERFTELSMPGTHTLPTVRVYIPGLTGEHVAIQPGAVRAVLEVRDRDQQERLPFVVVYPVVPPGLLKEFRIEDAPETIPNVDVIGPPDQIALLRDPDYEPKPKALLEVSRDDATGTVRRRRLRFIDLPEGVREGAPREVEFRLVRITPD